MAFTSSFTGRYLVAPFWDDIDIGRSGTISYETFESGYYLEQVNAYIQRQRQNTFQGTWMINVYYKEVGHYSSVLGEVNDNTLLCVSVSTLRTIIIILVKYVGVISSYKSYCTEHTEYILQQMF